MQGTQLQVPSILTQGGIRKPLGMPALLLRGSEGPSEASPQLPGTPSPGEARLLLDERLA